MEYSCLLLQYKEEENAILDLAGIANTDALIASNGKEVTIVITENQPQTEAHNHPAASAARGYKSGSYPTGTSAWFLPSAGQWNKMVNAAGGYKTLKKLSGLQDAEYWTSTESRGEAGYFKSAWVYNFVDNGFEGRLDKGRLIHVRSALAF